MRRINTIFVHCSAGHGDLAAVKRWWHNPRPNGLGWRIGGYHKWVDYNGMITNVHPIDVVTNGVRNHNSDALHIAYRGGVDRSNVNKATDTRTHEQKAGLITGIREFLEALKQHQPIDHIRIMGHRDVSVDANGNGIIDPWERIKECPSFNAIPEYSWMTGTSHLS